MDMLNEPLLPDPVIEAYKKDVDRTLIRENLKLSHEERLLKLMQLIRFADELRQAGRRAAQQGKSHDGLSDPGAIAGEPRG